MIVQSSMLKTDYEMLQYPHCKCNNLGTLVGIHNFKFEITLGIIETLTLSKTTSKPSYMYLFSSFFKLFWIKKDECFMKRMNNFSIIYLQGEKIEVRAGQSS